MSKAERHPLKNQHGLFVPLADVADLVWRITRKLDSSNHFADMDQEGIGEEFAGKTLLSLTREAPSNVDPHLWVRFYESLNLRPKNQGALPFRVWQIFDAMVRDLKHQSVDRFVCAAGLLAHYVGDACQPLHISHLHHGGSDEEKGVHAAYETQMLNRFTIDLIQRVRRIEIEPLPLVRDGHGAAVATVELMRRTIKRLPPQTIIDSYNSSHGDRMKMMWDALGRDTVQCVADGSRTLAMIWKSAWNEGDGDRLPKTALVEVDRDRLRALYEDPKFLPAARLPEMADWLRPVTAGAAGDSHGRIPIMKPLRIVKKTSPTRRPKPRPTA